MSNPLLTIKKTDGTYKKMPLDQFKLPEKKIPLEHNPVPPKVVQVQKERNSLNDQLSKKSGNIPPTTSATNPADEIILALSFKVDASLEHRLRSAIQLRLKEIRGEEETRNTLLRDTKQGGLALKPEQATEVLKKCQEHLLPQVYKTNLPASPIKPTMIQKNTVLPKPVVTPRPLPSSPPPIQNAPRPAPEEKMSFNLGNKTKSMVKPVVNDIISKPLELGPIEEVGYITLVDLRRLAPNPVEAAARLGQKLVNLKAESIVLYLESVEAWKKSPLYSDYTTTLLKALAEKKRVAEVITDKQKIQLAEIVAVVNMEKEVMAL